MKLKKRKDESVDTSILLRGGNKIPMEGLTETKCRAETDGKAIQKLPHMGIHPIYSHQIQTLFLDANKCLLTEATVPDK